MSKGQLERFQRKISKIFGGQAVKLVHCGELTCWTCCFKVESAGKGRMFLKGTPRYRKEAQTTSILHEHCPEIVPKVINQDLLPDEPWRWFLTEDAGQCNISNLPPEIAMEAAFQLGILQNAVCNDRLLPQILPQCRFDNLQEAALQVCNWALPSIAENERTEISSLMKRISESSNIFHLVQQESGHLPSTCVHGDFWSGNIASAESRMKIIDWGDALWGMGGISIAKLLQTSGSTLTDHSAEIWKAYFRGWQVEFQQAIVFASFIAANVGDLVVDMEIARCCGEGAAMLPGLLPTLTRLVDYLERDVANR